MPSDPSIRMSDQSTGKTKDQVDQHEGRFLQTERMPSFNSISINDKTDICHQNQCTFFKAKI